jgi:hypothetical protein
VNINKKGTNTMKLRKIKTLLVGASVLVASLSGRSLSTSTAKGAGANDGNTLPGHSVININNMAYWMKKSSAGTTSGSPNGTQADYPIGTGGLVYEDGFLWGAKVSDGDTSGSYRVRVGGTTYYAGLHAGYVKYNADGDVVGVTDPADHGVWRVRPDWATSDLVADAANYWSVETPSADEIASVREDYEYSWNNWPADLGAPYHDENNDNMFNLADGDIPGYPGSAQTLWVVANDIPYIVDATGTVVDTQSVAENVYGAPPVGIELQVTMWAYAYGASDPLGNVIFKKAIMKYTGLPITHDYYKADAKLDTMYFTQWSDPDLGTYTDDYVGCDIDLSFGYVYNGNRLDGVYNGIFNLPVPAGGYDFLQGPVDNMDIDGDGDFDEYLPMTAFTYFGAGSSISDPDLSDYNGTLQFFNLMEGFLPRPSYPTQIPWTDPSTEQVTNFALSGDPVSGSGWIDGVQLPPGDRRLVMSSGPYDMELGSTAEVVLAVAAGTGNDAVSSVSVAKYVDTYAQYAYDNDFSLPSAPTKPSVNTIELDGSIALDWGSDETAVDLTELPVSEGFEFEGYNVYQLPGAGSPLTEGVKVATFDKINLIQNILDNAVDPLTGLVVQVPKQTGTDAGVQRHYNTDYDELRGRPMANGVTYYYAITAYSFLADNEGSPFKTLESPSAVVAVTPHSENPGFTAGDGYGDAITVTHTGTANASASVTVVNPSELTGDSYEIGFNEQIYWLDLAGNWHDTDPDGAGKITDLTGSSVTGFAESSYDVGTIDLVFQVDVVSPDYNYADGVLLTFPEGTVINAAYDPSDGVTAIATGNEVMFGDNSLSTGGYFSGGQVIYVNINTPADFPSTPLNVDYVIYDDGWAQSWCPPENCETCEAYGIGFDCEGGVLSAVVNATGTTGIDSLAYFIQVEQHWSLKNTTTSTTLLEKQTFVGGVDVMDGYSAENASALYHNNEAAETVDGFTVNVVGGYESPIDAYGILGNGGSSIPGYPPNDGFSIDSYYASGWAGTAKAIDTYGAGYTEVDYLQRDVKVVFDGVLGAADENGFIPVVSGGSKAWVYFARSNSGFGLDSHPSPENPGTGDPFLITVPFKIYDMEPEGGGDPVQINMIMYDRIQAFGFDGYDGSYDGNEDGTPEYHAFNPYDRMYTEFILRPYEETLTDFVSNEDYLTWNVVWWSTNWTNGDSLQFQYANPIQMGSDKFSWSTVKSSTAPSEDLTKVSVYPNPYYGFHELETSRSDKYVSFNNLPPKATISIYTLGGTFVRQIKKDDAGQFAQWDLTNQYEYPVASGLYIVHVESGGNEKIMKLALVQETQVLKYY